MTDRTCPLTSAEQMTETTWAILRCYLPFQHGGMCRATDIEIRESGESA